LRGRVFATDQRARMDGKAQALADSRGEQLRLIEAAFREAPGVQRHGYQSGTGSQDILDPRLRAEKLGEPRGDAPPTPILELVD